ncbi:hypothetical protein IFM89_001832 [Coptis chinensis]|uniref:Uncharacterized protein n=1 Tax=Coptis chinensis TaxID=261450 RepID=A0A835HJ01_9MAGN|nr:hypothetical protein IFM89_001832 [Coptis chinensis]
MVRSRSSFMQHIWESAVCGGVVSLWLHRNMIYFEEAKVNLRFCKGYVFSQIKCAAHMSKGFLRDSDPDKRLLISWGINCKLGNAPQIKPSQWLAPFPHMMKGNTDGSSLGNPVEQGGELHSEMQKELSNWYIVKPWDK